MRIAIVTDFYYPSLGGITEHVDGQARELTNRGHEVTVITGHLVRTPPVTDEDMIRLLTTGVWIDGSHLRPPMPQFRMSRDDAESVVAYLRSLRPGPGD